MSRRLRISLGVAAGIVLLALALRGVDAAELRRNIARANPGWLVAAAVLYLTAYFVQKPEVAGAYSTPLRRCASPRASTCSWPGTS